MGANWLKAIGDTLIAGGEMAGRNRARNLQEQRLKREDEEAVLRMALARESQDLAKSANTRAEGAEARAAALDTENRERRVIDDVGPGGMLSPEAAQSITTPGLRSRLGPQQEASLEATPFVADDFGGVEQGVTQPAQEAGVPVIPTKAESAALTQAADADALRKITLQDARQKMKAVQAMEHPSFLRLPKDRRDILSMQAYGKESPDTPEDVQTLLEAQHKIRMSELGVMYPSDRFGLDSKVGGAGKLSPWMQAFNQNKNTLVGAAMREATLAQQNGTPIDRNAFQAQINQAMDAAEAMTSRMLGPNPDEPVGPVEPANRNTPSPTAAWLGTLDDPTFEQLKAGLKSGDARVVNQLTQSGQTEESVRRELCRVDRTFCGRLR